MTPTSRRSDLVILSLFVFSGATSLVYEVLWLRQLILIFGSTQFATSTILSTFLGGLALGAFLAGRYAQRRQWIPLQAYGLLEIGIGVYALLVPWLFRGLSPVYQSLWDAGLSENFVWFSLAKFAGIAVVLLPPTMLMGASLPVLAKAVADDPERIGGRVGTLYAVNTFGAVAGTFLAGFVLIPGIGMRLTLLVTAAANVALGLTAIGFARGTRAGAEAERPTAGPAVARSQRRLVLFVVGLSGFGALVLEVAWTRVLSLIMGSSVYAFSLMLVAFLFGLAVGSAWFSRLLRRRPEIDPALLLAALLVATGVLAYATAFSFVHLPGLFARIFFGWHPGPNGWFVVQLTFGLLVMFPATFALGGIFPAVLQSYARSLGEVSGSVGAVYASNTAGTIFGAALAGFVLIPTFGMLNSIHATAVLELLLGAGVALLLARWRRAAMAVTTVALAAMALVFLYRPAWDVRLMNSGVYMNLYGLDEATGWSDFLAGTHSNNVVVYAKEGLTSSVFVADQPSYGNRYLAVNGKIEASTDEDLETQLLCAHLPLLLHEKPDDVLVIGLASGITAGAAATHPLQSLRVVEVEREMVGAARLFAEHNNHVLDDPRVTLSINDARNELEFSSRTYDVIISEPSNPWMTVAANLFTADFFAMARQRVRPGGVFCQWIQNYYLPADDLRSILAAFSASFPHLLLFETFDGIDLLVLGSQEPLELDMEALERGFHELRVRLDLGRIRVQQPIDLVSHFRLGTTEVERLCQGAQRNTDDNARVEFSAPKTFGLYTIDKNQKMIRKVTPDPLDYVRPRPVGAEARDELRLELARSQLRRRMPRQAAESARRISTPALQEQAHEIVSKAEQRLKAN